MNLNTFDPGYCEDYDLQKFGFKSVGRNVKVARNCTILVERSLKDKEQNAGK